jgi:Holliday junction DNA helicase RuvA
VASGYSILQEIKVVNGYPLDVIASISGTISRIGLTDLVIETSGIGYHVNVTASTALDLRVGQSTKLFTAHIIREDSQTLFGFESEEQLQSFNLLCSVSGVGPKSALSVIGTLGVDGLAKAVATADDSMFKSVSGIGPKTAKLIVLSLTGKLVSDASSSPMSTQLNNVTAALVGLGYQERSAKKAVEDALVLTPSVTDTELLRGALAQLSSARKVVADE